METTRLTDKRFFTECVDTTIPALAEVGALAEAGEFAAAQHIFADYVRTALDPDRYLAPEKDGLLAHADSLKAAAELVMGHTFKSCRVPYTFGETIDWEFNPTYNAYKEWPWQLNRHPEWRTLAQAYVATGDERYAEEWTKQLISWAVQAQVPENVNGYQTVCWRTIEAGIRMSGWAFDIHAFLRSPFVTDEILTIFFKCIWEHGWRLRNFNTARNWLIMEMHGLARIGLLYPFLAESAAWLEYAHMRLKDELDIQVYPDGMQNELSMGYHHVVVANYEGTLEMYRRVGKTAPEYLENGLSKLYDCYPKTARPDLMCPTMNDGGHLNAVNALRRGWELYPDRQDYRYIATRRAEGQHPAFDSLLLEYGGAVIMRSGWDPDAYWAYMDASPFGTAHQHEDKLNVQLFALGHELIPEAGTFDYDSSEMRKLVLSTRGHNTIRVDGHDQARRGFVKWEPEMIEQKADVTFTTTAARDTAEATYIEGYGADHIPVTHTRRFIFVKDEAGLPPLFIAVDRLKAADEEKHSYELMWHLHDNPTTLADHTVHNAYEDGVGITVALSGGGMSVVRGQKTPYWQGWLPKHGVGDVEHFPIPTVVGTGLFTGETRIVTVLCPYAENAPRIASVEASADGNDTKITVVLADGTAVEIEE